MKRTISTHHFAATLPVIFFLSTLNGCVSLKPFASTSDVRQLTRADMPQLNGSYSIVSSDTSAIMLDYCMTGNSYFDLIKKPSGYDRIIIETVGNNKLLAIVMKGEGVLTKKKIKGTLRKGCFEFSSYRIRPFILLNFYQRKKTRLALMKNGDLSVDVAAIGLIFLSFLPATGAKHEEYHLTFRKL